ncbi:hypothetical protein SteCoe_33180 [Stentor coeruleus]|uniref:Uncharacterized protein n=1 Tax=Stentor coeruleus TaxID=5963 RepID=A0A1R2AX97_9CILI|nr:hypothetical protein SteCoe_33180 [Stentor coeruleus]
MSDYDEVNSVSKGSASVVRSKKQARLRPGSLPWEEESMTFSRDKGALLLKLQRENIELRKKLKDFNSQLNDIIEKANQNKPKKPPSDPNPNNILETATKKLQNYEKEYKRLENRHSRLSDPNYEGQLRSQVNEMKIKVQNYENKHKKRGAEQKIREKELTDVLDTGEKIELQKQFIEINTELSVYAQRYEKLQELNDKTCQSYQDITSKLKDFERQYEGIKDKEYFLIEPEHNPRHENKSKLEKLHSANVGKIDSQIKALSLKIKKLNEEFNNCKENENKMMEDLKKKTDEYRAMQAELNDLQIKAMSNNQKKLMSQNSLSDDYVFATEKFMN